MLLEKLVNNQEPDIGFAAAGPTEYADVLYPFIFPQPELVKEFLVVGNNSQRIVAGRQLLKGRNKQYLLSLKVVPKIFCGKAINYALYLLAVFRIDLVFQPEQVYFGAEDRPELPQNIFYIHEKSVG
ncbi:MAG: hypothetical protein PHU49_00395 [Syntrophorhabdaceae bacterium]|nr:hypothetical protein [Syntrophorhabdaceae bacterium]